MLGDVQSELDYKDEMLAKLDVEGSDEYPQDNDGAENKESPVVSRSSSSKSGRREGNSMPHPKQETSNGRHHSGYSKRDNIYRRATVQKSYPYD